MKKILLILTLILSWNSGTAQCFSQAGDLSTTVIAPKFCLPAGGSLNVDITYTTLPVPSDVYVMLIVDNLTQTIQTVQPIGPVTASSSVVVNIPGTLTAGNYQIYGMNVDVSDPDIAILYPAGVADIIGTTLTSLIANVENLGGVSGTGNICGDITISSVSFDLYDLPTVTFTAPADMCIGSPAQNGLGGGTPTGGVYSGPGVTDDGNGMTYTFDPSALLNGVKTLTYTYTNVNGCTNSSSDDLEIFSLPGVTFAAPADVCAGSSILVGQTGGSPTGGVYSGTGVNDDGNGTTYSFDPGTAGVGIHLITYVYTDGNGCTANFSDNIEVGDVIVPTAICQNINVYLNGAGNATIVPADIDGGSTDNCGAVTLSASKTSFTCGDLGANNVTLTVTDGNSNSANCVAVVTVIDTVSPVAICQNISRNLDASGIAIVFTGDVDGGSTDNCGIGGLGSSPAIFNCSNVGTNNVTLTVNDVNGNSSTCTSIVTIIDVTAPTTICQDIDVYLDAAGDATIVASDLDGGSTDNCNLAFSASQTDFTCADLGANDITLTSTDVSGNSSNCIASVTVIDAISPTAICQNINVYLDGSGNVSIVAADIDGGSTDNCSIASLVASKTDFTCSDIGLNNVTLTVTDGSGNFTTCSAEVTVLDTISPVVTCPGNQIETPNAFCQFILPDYTGLGSATDNCDASPAIVQTPNPGTVISGATTITFTAVDGNGNTGQCSFNVTLVDIIAPSPVCQNIDVYLDASGNASIAAADLDGGSTDNCAGLTFSASKTSFNCGDLGANSVTLTVTDGNSNTANCVAVVTVIDTISPVITCPGNQTEMLDALCQFTLPDYTALGSTSDNCGSATLTQLPVAGTVISSTTTVTLTSNDGNGNTASCAFDVTLNDVTPPTAICKNITAFLDASGNVSITGADIDNGSTDNCGGVTLSASPSSFTCSDIGAQNVTLTVTDGNGNVATCVSVVTVADATNPIAVCQNISIQLDATLNASIVAADIDGGSTDNCNIASITASQTDFTCSDIGANNITLTVTDDAGNVATCVAIVTVTENVAPTASNPVDLNVECVGDIPAPDANVVTDAMDNCGAPIVTWVGDVSDGNSCPETITRTYNVADASGNSIDVEQSIIVMDVTAPTASNPGNITVQCIANFPSPNVNVVTDEADNCGTPTVAFISDVTDGLNCPETFTRTYRVTDDCGNSMDVEQLIIVNDISAPVPDLATLPTETFSCTTLPQAPTATDNCSGTIIGVSDLVLPITSFGATTITWTFTDNCGNESTQTQDVNIVPMDVSTFVLNDNVTIVANNTGGSYQWIDCGTNQPIAGETGPSYTATYNGSFAVEITKGNCFDVSACVTISTIGIEPVKINDSFVIYPNPTSGSVTISSGASFNKVEVLNALGQKVSEYKISETSKYSLTLPEENGVYLIKIYNNESMTIKRVVKR